MRIFVGKYKRKDVLINIAMGKANTNFIQMSDGAIVAQIGRFIKHTKGQQNKTKHRHNWQQCQV